MSDQNTLEILITTKAELAGAQALRDSLEQSIGKAKALGNVDEVKKLSGELTTVNGSIKAATGANAELAEAEKEGAAATEFLHKNHRQLHTLFGLMPGAAGQAGASMLQMLRGPIGPALALGLIIKKLGADFSEWQANLDAVGAAAAKSPFSEAIKQIGTDMETARSKAQAYIDTIATISQHEVTIAQALSSQLSLMHALAAARDAEAKAKEAADKAKVDFDTKMGNIRPDQAIIQEAGIEAQAAKDEAAAKKKNKADDETAKQAALSKSIFKQRELDAAAAQAEQELLAAQKHRDRVKDFGPEGKVDFTTVAPNNNQISGTNIIKTESGLSLTEATSKAQEDRDNWEKNVGTAQKRLADAKKVEKSGINVPGNDVAGAEKLLQETLGYYQMAEGQLNRFRQMRRQYDQANSPEANRDLQKKETAANEAQTKGKDNATESDRLKRELEQAMKENAAATAQIDSELAARLTAIMSQAVDKLAETKLGKEVKTGAALSDKYNGGDALSAAESDFVMQLDAALGGHAKTLAEAAARAGKYNDSAQTFYNQLLTLTTKGFEGQQKQLDQLFVLVNQ